MFQRLTPGVLEPPAFGLDISDLTVKFLRVARERGRPIIGYFGEIGIPSSLVVDGEIKDESALSHALERELRRSGVRERAVVASLPEEKSFVRVLELPKMKPADVPKAVRWEVEGVVPLPAEEMVYDFEVISGPAFSREHLDVLVIAFPRAVIVSYERALAGAGLLPLALELESQAIIRALLRNLGEHPPAILVDLGAARTSIIIVAGGSLIFTKSIPIGGRDFEQAIAGALGVSPEEARRLKIDVGLSKGYADGRLFQALMPLLSTLVNELTGALWFYRDHPRRSHAALPEIRRIILAGGDANLTGLEKYLSLAVKVETAIGDPFSSLEFPPGAIPPIPKSESLKYTTAIGLALRAIGQ